MKIKPLIRKSRQKKVSRPLIYFKTGFIIALFAGAIILGLLLKKYYQNKPTPKGSIINNQYPTPITKNKKDDILGKQTENILKTTPDAIGDITDSIAESINDAKITAQQKLENLVFSTTVKPIIEKINSLPDDKQEEVRKEICK